MLSLGGVEIVGDELAGDAGVVAGPPGSLHSGARMAGYQVERPLGRGGMAEVYLARDERLDRLVALKVLAPTLAADEGFRARFIRESRAAAAVDHPHIIPVFEAGEADGVLFIAMRYVPGGDVGSIVRREGPLNPGRAAAVIGQVGSALDAAHAAGLVHRDVKPANMLVDAGPGRSDHVYLSDFGLSKKTLAASVGLTGIGQFLGTLDYVAPEQIQGRPADGRTDQYGLACAAFELLTGVPPFPREEATAVMYAQLADSPPPVGSRRADLPPSLDQVLARALAKAPTDRYSSCQEFANALLQALGTALPRSGMPAPDHPPTQVAPFSDWRAPAAGPSAGTAGLAYAEAGLATQDVGIPAPPSGTDAYPATTAFAGPSARGDDQRAVAPGPAPWQVTPQPLATPPAGGRPSPGPSAARAPRRRTRLWLLAAAAIVAAGGTVTAVSLSGGRGGQPTAAATQSHVSQRASAGHRASSPPVSGPVTGTLTTTLKNPEYLPWAVAFGPGTRTLAVGSQNAGLTAGATYLWDTAARSITATLTDPGSQGVISVAFTPDGTTLATGDRNGRVYLWDTATGKLKATLTDPGGQRVESVAFGPGGATLAAADYNDRISLWDTATGKLTATLTDPGGQRAEAVAFGPGGTTLAVGDYNGSTYLWNVATGKLAATLTDPGGKGVLGVAFGPGGTTLAAADSNGSTYMWGTATGKLTATLTDPGSKGLWSVAFRPGGTTLAAADLNGSTYLWDTATGKLTATLTDPGGRAVLAVAFGPAGTTLAAADYNGSTYMWNIASRTP
jgi:WD40 repeat protein